MHGSMHGSRYGPTNLFLKTYNYVCFENIEPNDTTKIGEESTDLSPMAALEGDEEEVKQGKELKILTLNKLLNTLPVLLPQIKAGNNSDELKNEIREILYLLYQHTKITKSFYKNLIKSL